MSLRESLIRALGGYTSLDKDKSSSDSFIGRIPQVDLPEDTPIRSREVSDYLDPALLTTGFTKGQRTAVTHAINRTNFARNKEDELTIGDIRKMSDEEILGLGTEYRKGSWHPRQRTLSILRQLFGRD